MKVAVLGSYSTQYISSCLEYLLNDQSGERAQVFDGEYDSISSSILDDNSQLHAPEPDILVLLPDTKDIMSFAPESSHLVPKLRSKLIEVMQFYERLWAKAPARSIILQANFVLQNLRALGNLEANYAWSSRSFTVAVNLELMRRRPPQQCVLLLDFEQLASAVGKDKWFDYSAYNMYKHGFSLDFLPEVVDLIKR